MSRETSPRRVFRDRWLPFLGMGLLLAGAGWLGWVAWVRSGT